MKISEVLLWFSQVEERESSEKDGEERAEEEKEKREDEEHKDLEKGEEGFEEQVGRGTPQPQGDFHVSMLQRLNPSNPLRVAIPGVTRATTPSPAQPRSTSTPTPQVRTREKPPIFLFYFYFHVVGLNFSGFCCHFLCVQTANNHNSEFNGLHQQNIPISIPAPRGSCCWSCLFPYIQGNSRAIRTRSGSKEREEAVKVFFASSRSCFSS